MFLAAARDIDSTFLLDARLSRVREEFIVAALDGEEPPPAFMEKREQRVVEDLKWAYFNPRVRRMVELDESLTDDEDYASHSQKLSHGAGQGLDRVPQRQDWRRGTASH